jgi:hypothetical protein
MSHLYHTCRFITIFAKAFHWTISPLKTNQVNAYYQLLYVRHFVISSYTCRNFPRGPRLFQKHLQAQSHSPNSGIFFLYECHFFHFIWADGQKLPIFFPQYFLFNFMPALSSLLNVFQHLVKPSYSGSFLPLNLNSNAPLSLSLLYLFYLHGQTIQVISLLILINFKFKIYL